MNSISVKKLSKSFEDNLALDNLTFEVENGELFGIIGPDGAGKSTLFKILATLILPDSGKISILGNDLIADYKKIRSLISYMPQNFSLYADLTVEENLEFFSSIYNVTISENFELISEIINQLLPFKKRLAKNLSGGMQQKLALSCSLIHRPTILLLDEPTMGVDAISRAEFWKNLKILKKFGITTLVSTAYMDEAQMCDRVAFLNKGKILEIDTPEGILEKYNRKIYSIRSKNNYELVKKIRNFNFTHSAYIFGDCVHYVDKRENVDVSEITLFLNNFQDVKIEPIQPIIEDCFINLIQES